MSNMNRTDARQPVRLDATLEHGGVRLEYSECAECTGCSACPSREDVARRGLDDMMEDLDFLGRDPPPAPPPLPPRPHQLAVAASTTPSAAAPVKPWAALAAPWAQPAPLLHALGLGGQLRGLSLGADVQWRPAVGAALRAALVVVLLLEALLGCAMRVTLALLAGALRSALIALIHVTEGEVEAEAESTVACPPGCDTPVRAGGLLRRALLQALGQGQEGGDQVQAAAAPRLRQVQRHQVRALAGEPRGRPSRLPG